MVPYQVKEDEVADATSAGGFKIANLDGQGILHNHDMMEAIRESDAAKKRGIKTWALKF